MSLQRYDNRLQSRQLAPQTNSQGGALAPFGYDNKITPFFEQNDPFFSDFSQMHNQMMQSFSNMTQFMMRGSPLEGLDRDFESLFPTSFEERDINRFSDAHKRVFEMPSSQVSKLPGGGQFQCYSQSMVQKHVIGPDGKPKLEKIYNDSTIQRDLQGNTISQSKQAYNNELSGKSIVAQEQMLNDQGYKYIKERDRNGIINDQNLYQNIEEDKLQDFQQRFEQQKKALPVLTGPSRYLQINGQPQQGQQYQQRILPEQSRYQNQDFSQQQQQQQQLEQPRILPDQSRYYNQSSSNNYPPYQPISHTSSSQIQRQISPSYTLPTNLRTPQAPTYQYSNSQRPYSGYNNMKY